MLKKILKEIKNSRREGAEEMEFPEGHLCHTGNGVRVKHTVCHFWGMVIVNVGLLFPFDIPNFCGK